MPNSLKLYVSLEIYSDDSKLNMKKFNAINLTNIRTWLVNRDRPGNRITFCEFGAYGFGEKKLKILCAKNDFIHMQCTQFNASLRCKFFHSTYPHMCISLALIFEHASLFSSIVVKTKSRNPIGCRGLLRSGGVRKGSSHIWRCRFWGSIPPPSTKPQVLTWGFYFEYFVSVAKRHAKVKYILVTPHANSKF